MSLFRVLPLIFFIYNTLTHNLDARVCFSLDGTIISQTPKSAGAFTVECMTDTSNLPYQSNGNYYGYDERTGYTVTGFHNGYGYGYGYGYGGSDLTILYKITYKTCKPGAFSTKLFVETPKYTYESVKTSFKVLSKPSHSIYVDIIPGCWPNRINAKNHGYISVAICGTKTFNVHSIDPKTITVTLDGGKNIVKTPCWSYKDVATPWIGSKGKGRSLGGDGYMDFVLKFRVEQFINVLKLFKHPGEKLRVIVTGSLKKSEGGSSTKGYDYVQISEICKR
jgi:hypothetical protein